MPCMPIIITSDWGIIGPFSWINSRQSRAVFRFAFDPVPMRLRLQFWGVSIWDGALRPDVMGISVIQQEGVPIE